MRELSQKILQTSRTLKMTADIEATQTKKGKKSVRGQKDLPCYWPGESTEGIGGM